MLHHNDGSQLLALIVDDGRQTDLVEPGGSARTRIVPLSRKDGPLCWTAAESWH